MAKKRMGKGLNALIPVDLEESILQDSTEVTKEKSKAKNEKKSENGIMEIAVDKIRAAESQARVIFDDKKLDELVASIREHGIIQPLLVRKIGKEYELIAGERRLRAGKKVGLTKVPVIVSDAESEKAAEIGLIENIQRENLNAMEEASAYREMMDRYGYTQESLSKTLGKSRSYIANTLRLLALDTETKELLQKGKITAGHGRALLSVKAEPRRIQLRNRILKDDLSVRQAEEMAKLLNEIREKPVKPKKHVENPFYSEMESKLRERFQTKIKINGSDKGGKIELSYHNSEELERLLDLMIEPEK